MAKQYQISVGGVMYGMGDIFSASIRQPLFDKFGVGNTCSQELTVTFMPGVTPPNMAEVIPYYADPDNGVTEFQQLGVFWVDVREVDDNNKTTITAYDAMLKMEQPFNTPGDIGQWPRTMDVVAGQIVEAIGIALDDRTVISPYTMQYPNDYTMRDVMGFIAAANGGNWIITAQNQALLVPLFSSMPPDTNYLVDSASRNPILMGDVRLVVA